MWLTEMVEVDDARRIGRLEGLLGEFRAVDSDDVPDLVQAAVQFRKRMVKALDTILTRIDGEDTDDVGMTVNRVEDCAEMMEGAVKKGATVDGLRSTITALEPPRRQ